MDDTVPHNTAHGARFLYRKSCDRFLGQRDGYTVLNESFKEDMNMTTLTMIFTLCGAATIAKGLMEIIARLDGE